MTTQINKTTVDSVGKKLTDRIRLHYQEHPFRVHFATWLLIGLAFGLLMLPNLSFASFVGFITSGCFFCGILSFATYPLSGHFRFTLVGALFGVLIALLFASNNMPGSINVQAVQVGLLTGAMLGGTSLVWQAPIKLALTAREGLVANPDNRRMN